MDAIAGAGEDSSAAERAGVDSEPGTQEASFSQWQCAAREAASLKQDQHRSAANVVHRSPDQYALR